MERCEAIAKSIHALVMMFSWSLSILFYVIPSNLCIVKNVNTKFILNAPFCVRCTALTYLSCFEHIWISFLLYIYSIKWRLFNHSHWIRDSKEWKYLSWCKNWASQELLHLSRDSFASFASDKIVESEKFHFICNNIIFTRHISCTCNKRFSLISINNFLLANRCKCLYILLVESLTCEQKNSKIFTQH